MPDKVYDGGLRLFALCVGSLGFLFLVRAAFSLLG